MNTKLRCLCFVLAGMLSANAGAEVEVSTKGGLKVKSGDHEFKFGGRIMYDYNRSKLNGVTDEDDFDLRRGRVYASGNISKDWSFKTQFNVNGDGVEDLYLRYSGFGPDLTIGNQKMPFGLEELTSSKDISVLERSAITERYAVGRAEGLQLDGGTGNQTWALGVFNNEPDTGPEETGFAARYTIAPMKTDTSVFHLGIAFKDIDVDEAVGFEAAFVSGPFHIQAEWVDGEEGGIDLDGFYVQAGFILTGETRPYSGGKFKRVNPEGPGGAWELVLRYEDGDGDFGDVELGETDATAYTIGLNWYAHKNVRLGINYTDGEDNLDADEGEEFRVRFQLTF